MPDNVRYNTLPTHNGILCTSSNNYDNISFPHCHVEYELTIIASGVHGVTTTTGEYLLRTGGMILLRPNEPHSRRLVSQGKFVTLVFPASEVSRLIRYLGDPFPSDALWQPTPPISQVNSGELGMLLRRIERINLLCSTDSDMARVELRALLTDICLHCLTSPTLDSSNRMPWFSKLLREMNRPENIRRGLDAMLELSPYSHEYLCREFKRMMECTPTEYINVLRLNQAQIMLEDPSISIMDVCYAVGFESVSYFYRLFKNKYGSTPSRYRKMRFISNPSVPQEQRSDLSE